MNKFKKKKKDCKDWGWEEVSKSSTYSDVFRRRKKKKRLPGVQREGWSKMKKNKETSFQNIFRLVTTGKIGRDSI